MIYRRRRSSHSCGGFFVLEEERTRSHLQGFGFGDYICLRDEAGTLWRGTADRNEDEGVRYTFRDSQGRLLSGIADQYGLTLRDGKGKTWRGFVE